MKRLLLLASVALLGIALLPAVSPTNAQSNDTVNARIDLVMEHLTDYLNYSPPITRSTHFWNWSQNQYGDAALGCPDPAQSYAQLVQNGYVITITVDGVDYDYRVADDGSFFTLCGPNGVPLYDSRFEVSASSTNTSAPPATNPTVAAPAATSQQVPLPPADYYVWMYSPTTDNMVLLGADSVLAVVPRPSLADITEATDMVVSPDGRILIQEERVGSNRQLTFYNFQTGQIYAVYPFEGFTEIFIRRESVRSNTLGTSTYQFSPDGSRFALSFQTFDPAGGRSWRLVVFDTNTGNVISELNSQSFAATTAGIDFSQLPAPVADQQSAQTIQDTTNFVPLVAYYAPDGTIHFQLARAGTAAFPFYAAFAWNPNNAGVTTLSPYIYAEADVLSDGRMVYAEVNASIPQRPARGPFTSLNQIRIGTPTGTVFSTVDAFSTSDNFLWGPQFASADGSLILVRLDTDDTTRFALVRTPLSTEPFIVEELPQETVEVYGVNGGAVGVVRQDGVPDQVVYTAPNLVRNVIFNAPSNEVYRLVWASPPGTQIGISSVETVPTVVSGVNSTISQVICDGSLPTRLRVGQRAQVAFTADGTPLRLRLFPNGDFVQDLPQGTPFTITATPTCEAGFTWWRIELADGTVGYSAEGDSNSYFIEPVS